MVIYMSNAACYTTDPAPRPAPGHLVFDTRTDVFRMPSIEVFAITQFWYLLYSVWHIYLAKIFIPYEYIIKPASINFGGLKIYIIEIGGKTALHKITYRTQQVELLLVMQGIETNTGCLDLLKIAHININSITALCRHEEFHQFIITNETSIRTKLDETIDPSLYKLAGFHAPLLRSRNRHGRLVAVVPEIPFLSKEFKS